MDIWAFDPASACGFAMGAPPNRLIDLNSGVWGLRREKGMTPDQVAVALYSRLRQQRDLHIKLNRPQPDMIVYELPLPLLASLKHDRPRNPASVLLPQKLEAMLHLFAATYEIRIAGIDPQSWRAGFLGGKVRSTEAETASEAGKRLTCERARMMGYVPMDCHDHDRCDAVGLWHVAQIKFAHWQPPFEVLFNKPVRVAG